MRKLLIVAAVVVAGCSQATPDEAQTQDVVAALSRGSGEACTSEATIQVVRNIIYGEATAGTWSPEHFNDFLATLETGLELVTLDGVDETTKKVTCRGKFVATWQGEGGDAPIDYTVQPSLDESGGFVVYVEDMRGPRSAYYMAKQAYYNAAIAPALNAENARRMNQQRVDGAADFCRQRETAQVTAYDLDHARNILTSAADLGLANTDPSVACVRRMLDGGVREAPEEPVAPIIEEPPRKEDRIEYIGPPTNQGRAPTTSTGSTPPNG